MTTIVQSAIKEVRDQLLLDTADGEYLNNLGNNYGVARPPVGFTDTVWRAVVKELALHYKQIKTKFESILAILFGPKNTVVTGLSQAAAVGDMIIYGVDTSRMPQCGSLTLDKGLATEETVSYNLIQRQTNKILLDTPLTFSHNATDVTYSEPLLVTANIGDTSLIFADVDYLDNLTTPFSLTLGRGTNEETVSVSNVDASTRTLTVTALTKDHNAVAPTVTQTALTYDYNFDSFILQTASTKKFPEVGTIVASQPPIFSTILGTTTTVQIAPGLVTADQHVGRNIVFTGNVTPALTSVTRTVATNSGTVISFAALGVSPAAGDSFYIAQTLSASVGTATTVTVGSPTYVVGEQVGNSVCFVGNVTSALTGVVADVVSNTNTVLTFSDTITAPAAGDLFYIRPKLSYTRNSLVDNALIFRKRFPVDSIPAGTTIELLNTENVGSNSGILLAGVNWDVIQSDDRHVELLLPIILNKQDIRTASYLHEGVPTPVATTLASPVSIGDTSIPVVSTVGFPRMGVMTLGGTNYGYYVPDDITHIYESIGSTNLTINVLPATLVVNALDTVLIDDVYYTVASNTVGSITFTNPIKNHVFNSLVDALTVISFVSVNALELTTDTAQANHLAGTAVALYAPTHADGTATGDLWDVSDVFPGPYVYDTRDNIPYNLDTISNLAVKLAGPVRVVVDQNNFNTALEVVDASFLPFSGYPHQVRLGATTGNLELVDVVDVNLKQRVATNIAVASAPGASYIEVAALGVAGGARFPNSKGYRVLVSEGTAREEVIYALSTDGVSVPPRIYCEPTVNAHNPADSVSLMADVVSVSGMADVHSGYISYADRKTRWPTSITSTRITNAETLEMLYTTVQLTASTGMDVGSSTAIINAYDIEHTQKTPLLALTPAGTLVISVSDSSFFPTTGYPYPIFIGKDRYDQEIVMVTNNNTGAGILSLSSVTRNSHDAGVIVMYSPGNPEELTYSSLVGNSLRFLSPIVLKSNHYIGEPVVGSRISVTTLKKNGYDFPLRMPTNPAYQLEYLIDLVRAAGVKVTIIYAR